MPALYPKSDSGLLTFASNMSARITAGAAALGFTTVQASSLATLFSSYQSSYNAAITPATRTKITLQAKDSSKKQLLATVKSFVGFARTNLAVTNAQLAELMLPPRRAPVPKPTPATAPLLSVLSVVGWTVRLKLKASSTTRRGRPLNTSGATIMTHVGPTAPTSTDQFIFQGNCGRSVVSVDFDPSLAPGTKVWISAFWFNDRKESGPAADPVSVNLQGGTLQVNAGLRETDGGESTMAIAA